MSADGQRTKCRRNTENFDRLSRVHERYRQTDDRQTNGRQHSEREREHHCTRLSWTAGGEQTPSNQLTMFTFVETYDRPLVSLSMSSCSVAGAAWAERWWRPRCERCRSGVVDSVKVTGMLPSLTWRRRGRVVWHSALSFTDTDQISCKHSLLQWSSRANHAMFVAVLKTAVIFSSLWFDVHL